jgi:hypothetical protein
VREAGEGLAGYASTRLSELWQREAHTDKDLLGRFEEDIALLVGELGQRAATAAADVLADSVRSLRSNPRSRRSWHPARVPVLS